MKFIQYLKRVLLAIRESVTRIQYNFLADQEGFWTEEDALRVKEFFKTGTGKKLRIRLTNYVCRSAVEATRQTHNFEYHSGLARGVSMTVDAIEQHFTASSPRSEDNSESQQPLGVESDLALR